MKSMKIFQILILIMTALFPFACASERKAEDFIINFEDSSAVSPENEQAAQADAAPEYGIYKDGVLTLSDGSSFTGKVSEGNTVCWGVLVTPNGGRYEGHFEGSNARAWQNIRNALNGQGECRYPNGGIYEGNFKDGLPEGRGTWHYPKGGLYKGSFHLGVRDGSGTYVFPDGAEYTGTWKKDKFHGIGTYTLPDGMKFTGRFLNGKIEFDAVLDKADRNIEKSIGE